MPAATVYVYTAECISKCGAEKDARCSPRMPVSFFKLLGCQSAFSIFFLGGGGVSDTGNIKYRNACMLH